MSLRHHRHVLVVVGGGSGGGGVLRRQMLVRLGVKTECGRQKEPLAKARRGRGERTRGATGDNTRRGGMLDDGEVEREAAVSTVT